MEVQQSKASGRKRRGNEYNDCPPNRGKRPRDAFEKDSDVGRTGLSEKGGKKKSSLSTTSREESTWGKKNWF